MQQPTLVMASLEGAFDSVGQAASAFDEEERELWRQLRRKRDFEGRVAEKRAQLAELRERRRTVSCSLSEAGASVEHLASELNFVKQQEREIEHDIAVLKESNRILQQAFQSRQQQQPPGAAALGALAAAAADGRPELRDAMAEERARRESVQAQHEQISHLRAHLERLRAEKAALQQRQAALFDRQRSAEQDRNRLIGSLQDDRSGINELRAERIRLWEERAAMEREMARILHEVQASNGEVGAEASRLPASHGAVGGVRGDVSRDTPLAFAGAVEAPAASLWEEGAGPPPMAESPPVRSHWTSFADGGEPEFGGSGKAGTSGNGLLFGGLTGPPSFSHLGGSPGGGGASPGGAGAGPGGLGGAGTDGFGVTEWSGTLRDFKASSGETGSAGRFF